MVEVKNLKKYFKTRKSGIFDKPGTVRALDGIDFSIKKGQTLGMVGESGSGKTTATRSILRLIEPDDGEIIIDDVDVHSLDKNGLREFRKNMQLVFQDPYSSLNPRMTIGKIISEPLGIHSLLKKNEISDRLDELLNMVGLKSEHAGRYPHEFSGGQRQRIGIARAIALNPKFIILDEPVSALDVSIQGQVLNLLSDLQKKLGLTYLFVAHDLAVVEHMSDELVIMYLGRIAEKSTKQGIYESPLHPYTKSLMKSIPEIRPEKRGITALTGEIPSPENPPSGCYFHPRCPQAMDICRKEYPETRQTGDSEVACHLY
jgi:oligopeptide transport system ATP-binding protein